MIDGIRRSVDKRTCTAFVPMPPEPVFCMENIERRKKNDSSCF